MDDFKLTLLEHTIANKLPIGLESLLPMANTLRYSNYTLTHYKLCKRYILQQATMHSGGYAAFKRLQSGYWPCSSSNWLIIDG